MGKRDRACPERSRRVSRTPKACPADRTRPRYHLQQQRAAYQRCCTSARPHCGRAAGLQQAMADDSRQCTGNRTMSEKRVYLFHEGNAEMRDLLGGKGANLAEMTNIGLPVPPGFTITTHVCGEYYANGGRLPKDLMEGVREAVGTVEGDLGKKFGD